MEQSTWQLKVINELKNQQRSQAWLARQAQIEQSALNRMLNNKRNFPQDKMDALASALNISKETLFS